MAKKKSARTREGGFEGASYEELKRELGFDLTREECFRELFADLLEPPRAATRGPARVTQTGPGRRSGAKPKPETEVEPELEPDTEEK